MLIAIVRGANGIAVASATSPSDEGGSPEPPSAVQQIYMCDSSAVWGGAAPEAILERVHRAFQTKDSADPGWIAASTHAEDLRGRVAAVVQPILTDCKRQIPASGPLSADETTILLAAHLTPGPCAVMVYGNGFSEVVEGEHLATGLGELAAASIMSQFDGLYRTVQQAQIVAWAAVRQAIAWTPELQEPISLAIVECADHKAAARIVEQDELYEIGAAAEFWIETHGQAPRDIAITDGSKEMAEGPPLPPE